MALAFVVLLIAGGILFLLFGSDQKGKTVMGTVTWGWMVSRATGILSIILLALLIQSCMGVQLPTASGNSAGGTEAVIGRTYEEAVDRLLSAVFTDEFAEAYMDVVIPGMLDSELIRLGMTEEEFKEELQDGMDQQVYWINQLYSGEVSLAWEIVGSWDCTEEELTAMKKELAAYGVDVEQIRAGVIVTVLAQVKVGDRGLKNADDMEIELVQYGSDWYWGINESIDGEEE